MYCYIVRCIEDVGCTYVWYYHSENLIVVKIGYRKINIYCYIVLNFFCFLALLRVFFFTSFYYRDYTFSTFSLFSLTSCFFVYFSTLFRFTSGHFYIFLHFFIFHLFIYFYFLFPIFTINLIYF